MKLRKDYFVPGKHHVCMFCETPLAKLVNGVLRPLASKAHVLLTKKFPGLYIINCCKDCAMNVDFKDPRNLTLIHHNCVYEREMLDAARGKNAKEISAKRRERLLDRPVSLHASELETADRAKNVLSYERKRS